MDDERRLCYALRNGIYFQFQGKMYYGTEPFDLGGISHTSYLKDLHIPLVENACPFPLLTRWPSHASILRPLNGLRFSVGVMFNTTYRTLL